MYKIVLITLFITQYILLWNLLLGQSEDTQCTRRSFIPIFNRLTLAWNSTPYNQVFPNLQALGTCKIKTELRNQILCNQKENIRL